MLATPDATHANLKQVVEQILSSRRMTRADQMRFMSIALAKGCLNGEEQQQVDRVFEALKRGLLKVVD